LIGETCNDEYTNGSLTGALLPTKIVFKRTKEKNRKKRKLFHQGGHLRNQKETE